MNLIKESDLLKDLINSNKKIYIEMITLKIIHLM
jgi:hypothetical protein